MRDDRTSVSLGAADADAGVMRALQAAAGSSRQIQRERLFQVLLFYLFNPKPQALRSDDELELTGAEIREAIDHVGRERAETGHVAVEEFPALATLLSQARFPLPPPPHAGRCCRSTALCSSCTQR
jgi:hypothetical protein